MRGDATVEESCDTRGEWIATRVDRGRAGRFTAEINNGEVFAPTSETLPFCRESTTLGEVSAKLFGFISTAVLNDSESISVVIAGRGEAVLSADVARAGERGATGANVGGEFPRLSNGGLLRTVCTSCTGAAVGDPVNEQSSASLTNATNSVRMHRCSVGGNVAKSEGINECNAAILLSCLGVSCGNDFRNTCGAVETGTESSDKFPISSGISGVGGVIGSFNEVDCNLAGCWFAQLVK